MQKNLLKTKAVFGPIKSRRLGLSLGVDLLPYKTCPLDCVYCECGATTNLTAERREYYPTDSVISEIDDVLSKHPKIDFLTFSGVGEPTLHSGIGAIVEHVKKNWPGVKIALITNAVLLSDPDLQRASQKLDVIMPSLDASNEEEFIRINRPAEGVTFEKLVDSIRSFRKACKVPMLLEIFIVPGVNDSVESMARFREILRSIRPDSIQLNSLDRPGIVDWIRIPSRERLEKLAEELRDAGPVEIISRVRSAPEEVKQNLDVNTCNERILTLLRSQPCTLDEVAALTHWDRDQIFVHLRWLEKAGLVVPESVSGKTIYRCSMRKDNPAE